MNYLESENNTKITHFVLVGVSGQPHLQIILFLLGLVMYLVTVIGNTLIIVVIILDSRLHTPMYFFLSNLSFLDICGSTTTALQSLINCLQDYPIISYNACYAEMGISLCLGVTECFLLSVMAYDRFVAISSPLRYTVIMNKAVCLGLTGISWTIAFFTSVIPMVVTPVNFCGNNVVNHFACEMQAVLKLVCSDTSTSLVLVFVGSIFTLVIPFGFIILSYLRIVVAVLNIRSTEGRLKAFSTCGSHLTVVTIYYGTLIYMYAKPQTRESEDKDKIISIFYGSVTPMLNPLIYTLRNKDVKGALRKIAGKSKA
ncbi:LOW QUALITY PROTEIN: olfactory receptor 13H1-like [Sarcophilus harrisii]|uniref:LOW QUALITY PROTEIN: olfactory receptor 13H1-like n=1 Tax=Sarcophilus harrisii TaxID=9305 RepID=UPI00062B4D9D|nr:LOW QUALITY PROTEIN: olfactory receptor 13H1-like [Sarcophilus harrisii]